MSRLTIVMVRLPQPGGCALLRPRWFVVRMSTAGKDQLSYLRDGFSSKNGGNDIEEVYVEPLNFLLERGDDRIQLNTTKFSCQSKVCVASKPVRIDNNALTVYIPTSESRIDRVIKPYVDKLARYQVSSV
ncbi:hypothetical protein LWI28_022181 [Acer negundo]|uniref:Uncharacterized protein n=1 Tax=Acer negundo TaxID=4023 RepID=A0AAD5J7F3_ACENE|nr:hypothetical protein LWI28_022181 [Acer negundo]